jgi:hypothetical protein
LRPEKFEGATRQRGPNFTTKKGYPTMRSIPRTTVPLNKNPHHNIDLYHGRKWGRWTLDAERLVLVLDGQPMTRGEGTTKYIGYFGIYEIDVERIRQSSNMLDSIFQVRTLAWLSAKDIRDFLQALDDIFHPQAHLCSFGADKKIPNPTAFLKDRIETERAA